MENQTSTTEKSSSKKLSFNLYVNGSRIHRKGNIIRDRKGYHKCVCVDKELAIFAASNKAGTRVKLRELFAVHPKYTIYFEGGKNYCEDEGGYLFSVASDYGNNIRKKSVLII